MARGKWVCSYKKTTLLVCFFNIAVALYALHSLYSSLYIYSGNVPATPRSDSENGTVNPNPRGIKPVELIKWKGNFRVKVAVELPRHLKQNIIDEILQRLRSLNFSRTDIAKEREVVESWRKEKLEEVKSALVKGTSNSTIPHEEAGMLVRALESNWAVLCEEIGLWIPAQVSNEEHDDKLRVQRSLKFILWTTKYTFSPEDEILPGRLFHPSAMLNAHRL
ncbi:hypothetical protein JHK84_027663 [Glycine max]|nr:hypothetical protein JHK84_027663 [Glycine max]